MFGSSKGAWVEDVVEAVPGVKWIYKGGKWIYKGIDSIHRGPREKAAGQAQIRFEVRRFHNMVGTAIRHQNQKMAITDANALPQTQVGLGQDQVVQDNKILGLDMKVLLGAGIAIALILRR